MVSRTNPIEYFQILPEGNEFLINIGINRNALNRNFQMRDKCILGHREMALVKGELSSHIPTETAPDLLSPWVEIQNVNGYQFIIPKVATGEFISFCLRAYSTINEESNWDCYSSNTTEANGKSSPSLMEIQGFNIHIQPKASANMRIGEVLQKLSDELNRLETVAPRVFELKSSVEFWITDDQWQTSAMAYHSSSSWLNLNNMNGDMANGIEIVNLEAFIRSFTNNSQPMIVLHELAHAYHHQVLDWNSSEIAMAFQNASVSGDYQSVPRFDVSGPLGPAYAITNEREYFAELTESYFGKNDYFPFTRSDLEKFDPIGFYALQSIWGP